MPWCAAFLMLVSYAADAGQDTRTEASRAFGASAALAPEDLIPAAEAVGFGFVLARQDALVRETRLMTGASSEFQPADELDPSSRLKPDAKAFPAIDRSHKGNPETGLRPTFDAKLRKPGSLDLARGTAVVFTGDDPTAEPAGFLPEDGPVPGPDSVARFEPMPAGMSLTTAATTAAASPGQASGATTPHAQDGSTPSVARAAALSSTTPATSDSKPIEIGALPRFSRSSQGKLVKGDTTVVGIEPAHPNYAALIDAAKATHEQKCLAQAVYFEARSEPEEGQAAVAQVVLNRVSSGLYPTSVCGVVFQNQQHRNACQFSFACEGRALRITEPEAWATAVRVARQVTEGSAYVSDIGSATHYHARYVRPTWAHRLRKMEAIGQHVFYKLRPGQT